MKRTAFLLGFSVALPGGGCTDYGFSKEGERPADDTRGPDGPDAAEDDDGGGDPEGDRGGANTDTASGDACWEPEDGYAQNPAARIFTTDGVTAATVTFVSSSTDYEDDLWLDAPEERFLARAWEDQPGTQRSVGPYAADTELIFGIDIWDTGEHFQSGPASRNSDGVEHVAVTYEGGCSWLIGFEDLTGGGDRDFNDLRARRGRRRRRERGGGVPRHGRPARGGQLGAVVPDVRPAPGDRGCHLGHADVARAHR